jgi:ABC-2 type transport system ATP-binding protein
VTFAARNVRVDFHGAAALCDVGVLLERGAVAAVVGGDGAGKSTLLRCFTGEVQPSQGHVERPDKQLIGYMPSTSGTWRDLTVAENIEFVARVFGLRAAVVNARGGQLLEQAGLAGARDRLARHLSGGMRQKLGFCLAMVHAPQLLVLDEPTTGVDPVSRVVLWRMIAQAAADGAAVLMATTYLDEAERASTVLVLDDGVQLLSGSPAALLAQASTVVQTDRPRNPMLAWRRGRVFHEWRPDGAVANDSATRPDLEDVVIAAMLERRHNDDDDDRVS